MFKKIVLKNGLRVVSVPLKNTQTATVLVLAATGSKYETREINGISHFLEHLLFKGTKKRPTPVDIAEPLDRAGGVYNAFTGEEYTGYYVKAEAGHFDLGLDVISDIYLNSKLDPAEIEKERGVIIEEINMYYDHPSSYVQILWNKMLYGDQPAGWEITGTKQSVSKISRQDLVRYVQNQYAAENTIVCFAGNIPSEKEIVRKTEKYFSGIRANKALKKPKVIEKQTSPALILHKRETDQCHLYLGVRGYDIFHPKKYAFEVLADILGGMMSSRLFVKIREEMGAAYYISADAESSSDTGFLAAKAGVDNKKIDSVISAILEEYRKAKEKKIDSKELKKSKEHIIGKMSLLLETSDAQASFYGVQETLEKNILTPKEIYDKINKVSAEDILAAAKEIFRPENLNLAIIGKFEDEKRFQKLLKI